jgi:hypothetical protein
MTCASMTLCAYTASAWTSAVSCRPGGLSAQDAVNQVIGILDNHTVVGALNKVHPQGTIKNQSLFPFSATFGKLLPLIKRGRS